MINSALCWGLGGEREKGENPLKHNLSTFAARLDLNPSSDTQQLCEVGQITCPHYGSVSASIKCG